MGFSNGSISKALNENRAVGSDRLETIVSKYPELNPMSGQAVIIDENNPLPYGTVTTLLTIDKAGQMMIPYCRH